MRQIPLFGDDENVIPLLIDSKHPMVRLTCEIDWDLLILIAQEQRKKRIKSSRGPQPNYGALTGAVVVRSLK